MSDRSVSSISGCAPTLKVTAERRQRYHNYSDDWCTSPSHKADAEMQVRNGKKVKRDKKPLNTFTKQAEPLLVSAIRRGGKKAQLLFGVVTVAWIY